MLTPRTYVLVNLLLIGIATLGAAHILVRTSTYGAALGNDSMNYISAAESLAAGEGLLSPTGSPQVLFPPFLSMVMAFIGLFGIEPVDSGRLVNAAAFGLTILMSGLWLSRNLRSRLLVVGAAVAVVAFHPLSHLSSQILTEPLFILFTLLALMQMESFLNRRTAWTALALSAFFAALAAVTRYMGITVIFAGVLVILARREMPMYAKLKYAAAYGAISSIPLAIVLAHNWLVSGTLTGGRSLVASGQSLSDSLGQIYAVFGQWAFPIVMSDDFYSLLWAVGLVVLGAAVFFIVSRKGRAAKPPFSVGLVLPFGVFALVYLTVIVLVAPFTVGQEIDSRYLAPVYAPLLLVAALVLDRFLHLEALGRVAVVKWTLASLILVGCLANVGLNVRKNLHFSARGLESGYFGYSLNTAYWDDSEMLKYVRANYISGWIYTNSPNPFRWRASVPKRNVHWVSQSPSTGGWICNPWLRRALSRSQELSGGEDAYIAWLDVREWDGANLRCDFLLERRLPSLELVAELADGIIFRVNKARAGNANPYRSIYESIVSGEPAGRSIFDVYLGEGKLTYVKEPCAPADTEALFFLHLIPADEDDLPDHRKQYGFDNLDFGFNWRGVIFEGKCMAAIALPEYAITRIRTGQFTDEGRLWEGEFRFDR